MRPADAHVPAQGHHPPPDVSGPAGSEGPLPVRAPRSGRPPTDAVRGADAPAAYEELLGIIGERVFVVHPRSQEMEGGGGDVDLFVEGLDLNWPLRLPMGWRLLQVLHYDIKGWYWVLEHGGETLAIDTVDDPGGLGRDGMPTARLIELAETHPEAARAAYLTAKRIRKGIRRPSDWERIAELATADPEAYARALQWPFGPRTSGQLVVRGDGIVPPDRLMRRARTILWLRRRSTPARLAASFRASAGRWYRRVLLPTGLYVVVAGPDGTGKTTLAEALPARCAGPFRRWLHLHWRPGLLPRAGTLVGEPMSDPTKPHAKPPHGPLGSLASLGYHWADFFMGGWLQMIPFRARSGLIVLERGWWDISVDPKRYRIAAPDWLVAGLGRLLVRPDLVLVLEAPADVLLARKAEVGAGELQRQVRAWRTALPAGVRRVFVDAARAEDDVSRAAREATFSLLTERASRRYGAGWVGLPSRSSPRWLLARGPRAAARSGPHIYQPVTLRGRIGWEAARVAASAGLLRLLPRAEGPAEEVRTLIAPFLQRGSSVSVMQTNHPNRCVALITGRDGRPVGLAKVALDAAGDDALTKEVNSLEAIAPLLVPPLRAPRVVERRPGALLLEAVQWSPRLRPWVLPEEVAHGLGEAFAAAGSGRSQGMAHGDAAPWNLLRTADGWVLVDWEDARENAPPFFDVWHYLVQAHILLGRPSLSALARPWSGPAWVPAAIRAYAAGAGVPLSTWRPTLIEYLHLSEEQLTASGPEHARGLEGRRRIVRAVT